jgi:predicted 2-oxoglutarate/Fe(II)-dependent dioxygenase YbiX
MVQGASNGLHLDTFDEDKLYDRSGILYLNDNYEGGEINFPEQGIKIKPEAGTLLVFFGDESRPHEVCEVTNGQRYNLVSFYEPRKINE